MNALVTNKLTKKYQKKVVVNELNLSVSKGIIYGFLGKNGAGKSTFINMITGITIPTSGTYQLNSPRNKIGVLTDYSTFYDNLTAEQHLKYFSNILNFKISQKEIQDILKDVGLEGVNKIKVKNYSFGMKKKLGIAQTLINNPEIIFLDEPTSGVDPNSILSIHKLIKKLASKGTTIFLTSHNLDEVEKLCDAISILDKGSIIVQGRLEDIKRNYTNTIQVTFMTDLSNSQSNHTLLEVIKGFAKNIELVENKLILEVTDKVNIAAINEYLVKQNIKVYGINVYEPTLEEIFINTGSSNN